MTDRGPLGVHDEHRLPERRCPKCGHDFNAASAVRIHGQRPRPGDLTVCIGCALPFRFQDDLSLRLLAPAEVLALDGETALDLVRIMGAIRAVRRREAQERHRRN